MYSYLYLVATRKVTSSNETADAERLVYVDQALRRDEDVLLVDNLLIH
jgi:hypothetical protein